MYSFLKKHDSHLYIMSEEPEVTDEQIEALEQAYDAGEGFFPENASLREYDV